MPTFQREIDGYVYELGDYEWGQGPLGDPEEGEKSYVGAVFDEDAVDYIEENEGHLGPDIPEDQWELVEKKHGAIWSEDRDGKVEMTYYDTEEEFDEAWEKLRKELGEDEGEDEDEGGDEEE
jgi:hypothetical protein